MARVATVLGAVLLALGTGLLALGMLKGGDLGVAGTLASSLGGMLILFIGAAMLVPVAVPLVARFVGWPAARFAGIPGRLARDNAIRNPGRTASTAAALMIGIALVSAIAVVGRSLKISAVEATESQIASSHVLQSQSGWESLPPDAARTLVGAPGVRALSSVRYDRGKIGKKQVDVSGIDPATIDGPYRFTWKQGTSRALATLGTTGALVRNDLAEQEHLTEGDTISLQSASGRTTTYAVRGIIAPAKIDSLLGHVVVTQKAFDATFPQPADEFTFVDLTPGTNTAALAARLKVFPDAVLRTTPAMIAKRQGDIDSLVALLTMLLVLAVITALLGMVNALALAVIERTREIGALRAVGMTRRQTRRMVRHEAVTTSLIGAAVGLPLGILVAGVVIQGLSRFGVAFHLPVKPLVAYVVVAASRGARGGAAGAAGGEARRAASPPVRVETRRAVPTTAYTRTVVGDGQESLAPS